MSSPLKAIKGGPLSPILTPKAYAPNALQYYVSNAYVMQVVL